VSASGLATETSSARVARHAGRQRKRGWIVRRALLAADVAGLSAAFGLAVLLFPGPSRAGVALGAEAAIFFATTLPVWIVAARLYGLYDRDEERAHHTTTDDLAGVFQLATLGAWLFVTVSWVTGVAGPDLSRVIVFWTLSVALVSFGRLAARSLARRHPGYVQKTVILGAGTTGRLVAGKIVQHPEYGIELLGFVDARPLPAESGAAPIPVLGPPGELLALVDALGIERVIVAFSQDRPEEMLELIRALRELDLQIDIVPRFFEVIGAQTTVHAVEGLALVGLPPIRLARSSRLLKRAMDIALSAAALVVLLPLLVVVAVLVRLDSPGPALFRQRRMGAGDRVFEILKFRTMVADAEVRKHEVRHLNGTGDPRLFKARQDPRVTRIGRPLRRLSLDELPQLVNVLRGDMSLVGPRPLPLDEDASITDWGRKRLALRPGVTGLWQVLGRSDIPFDEMLRLDYVYVTSWSLWNDVRIILRTLPTLAGRSPGAF
jgi:exopolysaccharide biosynthesis polyprenyl glycosylphosphotransferase